jgi:hypothetical protein
MLAASIMCGLAVFCGASTGKNHALAIGISLIWAFAVGMLGSLGTAAADVGNISLFTLCVYASQAMTPQDAALSGLLALSGGLLQTASAFLLWPTRPYAPNAAPSAPSTPPSPKSPPPSPCHRRTTTTVQMNAALQTLTSLSNDRNDQAERLLASSNTRSASA